MLPLVPGELVTAGEPPAAVLPLADVGLLPRVGAEVRLQVRGLGVGLPAARVVTRVARRLPPHRALPAPAPAPAPGQRLTRCGEAGRGGHLVVGVGGPGAQHHSH